MALGHRDFFALIHSGPQLVDPGVRDFRHRQIAAHGFVDKVNIPELVARQQDTARRLHVFLPRKASVCHIKEGAPAQLRSGSLGPGFQRQLVDFTPVRQKADSLVFLNAGEDKIAGPVDSPVPAGAGIGKAHDPLHMGRVFFQKPDAQRNGPALGIAREDAVKGHPVQFQIFVPAGACHQRQDFGFIEAWPIRHNPMEPPVQKYPEVQAAIIHHSAAVMVAAHKRICHLAGDHFQTNFFCSAH